MQLRRVQSEFEILGSVEPDWHDQTLSSSDIFLELSTHTQYGEKVTCVVTGIDRDDEDEDEPMHEADIDLFADLLCPTVEKVEAMVREKLGHNEHEQYFITTEYRNAHGRSGYGIINNLATKRQRRLLGPSSQIGYIPRGKTHIDRRPEHTVANVALTTGGNGIRAYMGPVVTLDIPDDMMDQQAARRAQDIVHTVAKPRHRSEILPHDTAVLLGENCLHNASAQVWRRREDAGAFLGIMFNHVGSVDQ